MITANNFEKALELINKSTNCLLSGHIRPDGDSCGSMMAMSYALRKLGKKTNPILLSPLAKWYKFLFDGKVPLLGNDITIEELDAGKFDDCDLVIIVDTNSYVQLPGLADWLKKTDKPILVMDHHKTSDGIGNVELINTEAAATGEIVFDLFTHAGWEIDKKIAEALFVAIATDTGWFKFSNVEPSTYRDAATLIEKGVDPTNIFRRMYQNYTMQRMKLTTAMMETMELHFDGRLAIQHIMRSDFDKTGATGTDTENLIEECQRIDTVEAAALLVELSNGNFRTSLRSKGKIDVRKIAQKYGGGGHTMASGVSLEGPLENAKKVILDGIEAQFEQIDKG